MDIVLVTYNSSKWIKKCLDALSKSEKVLDKLNIYIVDNNSSDLTRQILDNYDRKECFAAFEVNKQNCNHGFGKANNIGACMGNDDIICFINVDTEVEPNTLSLLMDETKHSSKNVAAWEMRQVPYEHPKLYNPVTRETSWISGAAFAIRRKVFKQVKGFDEKIFMYAEDVDLSWRIRDLGYQLKYCPEVVIYHYSYQVENEIKPTQYIETIKNNLLLRYRFGNLKTILNGHRLFWQIIFFHRPPFKGAKKALIKKYFEHWKQARYFFSTPVKNKNIAQFLKWDYEIVREGNFLETHFPEKNILVSVIVRTCQRPSVLRETLISLRNQTYKNFELIVVEDGPETAKIMVEEEFKDLNIRYYCTNERAGRSIAGNIGLEKAKGDYINFLDDDDLFFSDHLETLVSTMEHTKNLAAYSFGFETPIIVEKVDPYIYTVKGYVSRYKDTFDKVKLSHHNYIPIQCIMFSKKLYDSLGGFDTSLDYLEDWDLWVRYMQMTDFTCVPKTTSIYRVPYEEKKQADRQKKLDLALHQVRKKHEDYVVKIPVSDLVQYGEDNLWQTISKKFKFNR